MIRATIKYVSQKGFNSRSHVGSNTMDLSQILKLLCFNSRSHGGSDGGADSGYTKNAVSIHAPMEGAIGMDSHFNSHTPVSTHAPT